VKFRRVKNLFELQAEQLLVDVERSIDDNLQGEILLQFGVVHVELLLFAQILQVTHIRRVQLAIEWRIQSLTLVSKQTFLIFISKKFALFFPPILPPLSCTREVCPFPSFAMDAFLRSIGPRNH
jgi:hypothetical protein